MVKGKITFIQYFTYEAEGETEEECFEKAREEYNRDMRYSTSPWYDDVEEEYEYEEED